MATEDRLNTRDAAQLISKWYGCVTPGTLRNWRHDGKGPPYRSGKPVTYAEADLISWAVSKLAEEPRRLVGLVRTRKTAGTRSRIVEQCRAHEDSDDLAWIVLHWWDELRSTSIVDVLGTSHESTITVGELFLADLNSPEGNPRILVQGLREALRRLRETGEDERVKSWTIHHQDRGEETT